MEIHNVEQGLPEWFELRKGKMTASHAQAIASNGKGLKTYVHEVVAELYSSAEPVNYTSPDIERGNELEPVAREMYEMETGSQVLTIGFIEADEYVGASPDGLTGGGDGLVEIKCPKDRVFLELLLTGKIDPKYVWQMQMQMLIADRKWVDFVAYNPNFQESLVIIRVDADADKQQAIQTGLTAGTKMIKELKAQMDERLKALA